MPKPRKDKKFDPNKHHSPKEKHKLTHVDFAILAGMQEAMMHINNAKANLLAQIAKDKWGYPTGQVLEFDINFSAGEVTVIMKGQVKADETPANKE